MSAAETTLGEACDLLTGLPFKSANYVGGGDGAVRLLRGDNVAQGTLRWADAKFWPRTGSQDLDRYIVRAGDIILAMDRPWIDAGLKYAVVRDSDLPCLLVQRVARLRARPHIDQRFLGYVVGSAPFTDYVRGVETGSAVPHISGGQITAFRFPLPSLAEQRAIAAVLGALDDKIDLNRRMNETLEGIARVLFKSWFVDFDPVRAKMEGRQPVGMDAETAALFPREMDGEVPRGWRTEGFDANVSFLNGLALQKFRPAHNDPGIPVIKIADMRTGVPSKSERATSDLDARYIIADGDLLFSWSGSLEVVQWSGGRGALNQHLFKVTSARYPLWFVLGWLQHHLPGFRDIAADKATTMGHIQRGHLTRATIVVPPSELTARLDAIAAPLMARRLSAAIESRTLAELRDRLLPKLMSGETRVKDAEAVVHQHGI